MDKNQIIQLIIDASMSVFTLTAVLIALFQDRIKYSTFAGPNLKILYEEEPICFSIKDGIIPFTYFIRVTNKGISPAKNSKCELRKFVSKEKGINREFFEPRYLPWHLKTKRNITKLDLSPGEEKLIRFVFLEEEYPNAIFVADNLFSEEVADRINYINPHSEDYIEDIELEIGMYCDNGKRKIFRCILSIHDSEFLQEIKYLSIRSK